MSKRKLFFPGKDAGVTLSFQIFQILRYGCNLLIGIFLSRVLPIPEISDYENLWMIYSTLTFFWVTGLNNSLLSFIYRSQPLSQEQSRSDSSVFPHAFVLLLLLSTVFFMIFRFFEAGILKVFTPSHENPYFRIFSYYVLLNTPSYLLENIFLVRKKVRLLFLYGILNFCCQFSCICYPLVNGNSLEASFRLLNIYSFLKLSTTALFVISYSRPGEIRFNTFWKYLRFSIPLILTFLITGSGQFVDGILIANFFDKDQFAIYRYGAREFPLFVILASAFSVSMIPAVAESLGKGQIKDSLNQIKKLSRKYVYFLFPVCMILMLTSERFFPALFNKDFAGSSAVFNVYLFLIVSRYVFPQTILVALGENRVLLLAAGSELIINIIASLVLLNYYGMMGVVYGTWLANVYDKLFQIGYLWLFKKIRPGEYIPLISYSLFSILLLLTMLVSSRF